MYEFVLGRDPENETVYEALLDHPLPFVLTVFFDGPEFEDRARKPIGRHIQPAGGYFDLPPTPALLAWVRESVPLSPDGRDRAGSARTWAQLYEAVFSDDVFRDATQIGERPWTPFQRAALRVLATAPDGSRREADIEEIDGRRVRGWAVDGLAPDQPLPIEFWIDDAFVAATTADIFRRDVQDRFGGEGRAGFVHDLSDERRAVDGAQLEVRDAASRRVLATARLPQHRPLLEPHQSVRAELAAVKAVLERLEAGLPALSSLQGFGLEDYASYYDAFYRWPAADALPSGSPCGMAVIANLDGVDPGRVEDFVWSCVRQISPVEGLHLHGLSPEAAAVVEDLWSRIDWSGRLAIPGRDWLTADPGRTQALARVRASVVLMVEGAGLLAPDAGLRFSEAMAPGVVAAYADEDRYAPDGPADRAPHLSPRFKSGFDPDLLLQTPYVGGCAAFRTRSLRPLAGLAHFGSSLGVAQAVLRLGRDGGRVAHVPRLLWSAPAEDDRDETGLTEAWCDIVAEVLAREPEARVEPFSDDLGSRPACALRIRRSIPQGLRATVIVPTKDRLDLLRPCVESLWNAVPYNQTAMRLTIVDHASVEPETQAWLEEAGARAEVTVQRVEGAFNWALMNNLAAAAADDADVLIFLNNDTLVLSRDWLDELSAQAMRPEVGVVGGRLLYEDGTLQHGGLIARNRVEHYIGHEGVGLAGADGGYMDRYSLVRRTPAVYGACMAIRRQVFESLGGFDSSRLAIEGNDVDLCLKAQAAGLSVLYTPHATLYHLESKSRGFARSGAALKTSRAANQVVWDRWSAEGFGADLYNPHFDREARPFTRLRPPVIGWPEPPAAPVGDSSGLASPAAEPGLVDRLARRLGFVRASAVTASEA
jgi:GT2 family glycosyltransferase